MKHFQRASFCNLCAVVIYLISSTGDARANELDVRVLDFEKRGQSWIVTTREDHNEYQFVDNIVRYLVTPTNGAAPADVVVHSQSIIPFDSQVLKFYSDDVRILKLSPQAKYDSMMAAVSARDTLTVLTAFDFKLPQDVDLPSDVPVLEKVAGERRATEWLLYDCETGKRTHALSQGAYGTNVVLASDTVCCGMVAKRKASESLLWVSQIVWDRKSPHFQMKTLRALPLG